MVSKNCPEHISGWVKRGELFCEMEKRENRYITDPDVNIIVDGTGEVVTVNERKPQEALRKIQTLDDNHKSLLLKRKRQKISR